VQAVVQPPGSAVTGPWTSATNQGDGPIHDANTASPIVGDLVDDPSASSNAADAEMFDSPFPEITLVNTGDKIVFTGSAAITGTVNSPATSAAPRIQFRFGLFDGDEDGPDDTGWVGYFMSNKHGNFGGVPGALARKQAGNTSAYISIIGQGPPLATEPGDGTPASLFHDDVYSMRMTIERMNADLFVSATLTGANGFSQSLSGIDDTAAFAGTYTFDHLGFLLGGTLDTDRAAFSNLEVSFVPEPATAGLLLLALAPRTRLRRKAV
jgi:hypothetical protein